MKETKAFYLTSEFWVSLAVIVTALSGAIPHLSDKTKATLATIAAGAYAVARGLAKSGVPAPATGQDLLADPDDTLGGSDHPS